jgi:ATP-dependent Clp protease ATP-binding subunit ClpA
MHEHFTDRARKVMQLANRVARRFNHEYVGTEHILLGLVEEGSGVAANVLNNLDVKLCKVQFEVERIVQAGPDRPTLGKLPHTPRATKAIEYAIAEARNLKHDYVGTEHLLLGLLREQEGVAAQVLMNLGLRLEDVWAEIGTLLGAYPAALRGFRPVLSLRTLPAAEFPEELRPGLAALDLQIDGLNQEKEEAIDERDFETAARLLDQANQLKQQREARIREWSTKHLPDPTWLSWNNATVARLARTIVDDRRWGELPVLADALDEAGCTDHEMLNHCREGREHERGCWVVALLLRMK